MMNFELSPRRMFAGFALIPLALLAEALILQHLKGQAPCPLCVMQRAGFLLIALIALVALIRQPRGRSAAGYFAAVALTAVAGLGVAIRHVWLLYHPKFGCGIDVLEQFVNDLPTAKLALNTMLISEGIYLSQKLGCEVTAEQVLEKSTSTSVKL